MKKLRLMKIIELVSGQAGIQAQDLNPASFFDEPCCLLNGGKKITHWFSSREDKQESSFPQLSVCLLHCRALS